MTPLPPTAFVFSTRVRRIEDRYGPKFAHHLYTYDLATRSEKLVSNLDDDGTKPTIDPDQYSVSPDRRWIAFGSTEFRHTPDDRKLGFVGGILWAVSVDGKHFKRLTTRSPSSSTGPAPARIAATA